MTSTGSRGLQSAFTSRCEPDPTHHTWQEEEDEKDRTVEWSGRQEKNLDNSTMKTKDFKFLSRDFSNDNRKVQ